MNNSELEIIKKGICHYVFFNLYDLLSDDNYSKVINYIDPKHFKKLEDQQIINNKRLKKYIDFNRLDRKQVVRLCTRDIAIFEKIDLTKFNFTVSELESFLANRPEYVRSFNFDLEELNGKEIIILLKADLNYIYEIDFNNKKFTRLDFQDLIKLFYDIDQAMEKINFSELDNFLIRTLIIKTKNKYVKSLDLTKLNHHDWMAILEVVPSMIKHCPLELFETGDYFNLVQLVILSPELDYLIEKNKDKLSPLSWEKLIMNDCDHYKEMCPWEIFKEVNWKNILRKKPYLLKHKPIKDQIS